MSFFSGYNKSIDLWSVGCIFAEMFTKRALFPGKNYLEQLTLILNVLGMPPEQELSFIMNDKARNYVKSVKASRKVPWTTVFNSVTPTPSSDALGLLHLLQLYYMFIIMAFSSEYSLDHFFK